MDIKKEFIAQFKRNPLGMIMMLNPLFLILLTIFIIIVERE